ncbi:MAG: hypothetical protein ACI38Q_06080 [Candidatus Bruticola sp.]
MAVKSEDMANNSMAEADNYNENNISPMTVVLLTMFIGGCVWLGASCFGNLTDYGSRVRPEPVNLMAVGSSEDSFYSPARAKRRAGLFLRRSSDGGELSSDERAQLEEEDRSKDRDKEERKEASGEASKPFGESDSSAAPGNELPEWGEDSGVSSSLNSSASAPSDLTLSGIMLGSGAGVAVLDYNGVSYTKSEGDSLGKYTISKILSDRVLVKDGDRSLTLELSSSGSASSTRAADSGGFKNGHPVLPDPGTVPPPSSPGSTARTAFVPDTYSDDSLEPEPARVAIDTPSAPLPNKIDVYNLAEEQRRRDEKADNFYLSKSSTKANVKMPVSSPTPVRPTRDEITKYLQRGAAIVAEVKVQPDVSGLGVKVKFLKEDNLLNRLGLRDGDVITRINNKTVLSSEELFNSVLSLSEMPFVNIEYKRQGQTESIVYDL